MKSEQVELEVKGKEQGENRNPSEIDNEYDQGMCIAR